MKKQRRYWNGEQTVVDNVSLKDDLYKIVGFVKFMGVFFGIIFILSFCGSLNH
jgi:hypothetical protein